MLVTNNIDVATFKVATDIQSSIRYSKNNFHGFLLPR